MQMILLIVAVGITAVFGLLLESAWSGEVTSEAISVISEAPGVFWVKGGHKAEHELLFVWQPDRASAHAFISRVLPLRNLISNGYLDLLMVEANYDGDAKTRKNSLTFMCADSNEYPYFVFAALPGFDANTDPELFYDTYRGKYGIPSEDDQCSQQVMVRNNYEGMVRFSNVLRTRYPGMNLPALILDGRIAP